jgi:hypothetical protein
MASAEHSAVETSSETSDLGDKVVSKRKLKRKGSSKASERASGTESKGTTDTNSEDEDARPAKRSKTTNATKTSSKKTPKVRGSLLIIGNSPSQVCAYFESDKRGGLQVGRDYKTFEKLHPQMRRSQNMVRFYKNERA